MLADDPEILAGSTVPARLWWTYGIRPASDADEAWKLSGFLGNATAHAPNNIGMEVAEPNQAIHIWASLASDERGCYLKGSPYGAAPVLWRSEWPIKTKPF